MAGKAASDLAVYQLPIPVFGLLGGGFVRNLPGSSFLLELAILFVAHPARLCSEPPVSGDSAHWPIPFSPQRGDALRTLLWDQELPELLWRLNICYPTCHIAHKQASHFTEPIRKGVLPATFKNPFMERFLTPYTAPSIKGRFLLANTS